MVLALTHRPGAADAGFWTVATASGDWCVSGTPMTSAARRTDCADRARRTDCADRAGALAVCDGSLTDGFALAVFKDGERPFLARDPLGLKPLYQLEHRGRVTAFASELKAFGEASGLLPGEVRVFPPGHAWTPAGIRPFSLIRNWPHWPRGPAAARDIETAARDVRRMLERAVERLCGEGAAPVPAATAPVAVFLSGGIDSSAVAAAAAARLGAGSLRSFSVGTATSADPPKARLVARHLGLRHAERIFEAGDVIRVLPEVVYHLESCDPPLVRSSVANYLAAEAAAEAGCEQALCGEGGDELFAGYSYLKDLLEDLGPDAVPAELVALLEGGHGNGFQRVDRMTSAHGLEARVPLAAPEVVSYALRIPVDWKIPTTGREKLVLRMAFADALPPEVLERPKAKFYEGSGTDEVMAEVAERLVTDADFARERGRFFAPGRLIDSKEQLLYLRLFREMFDRPSALETISWTRTLGAPAEA